MKTVDRKDRPRKKTSQRRRVADAASEKELQRQVQEDLGLRIK